MSENVKGRLQFDRQRGVIYFHDEKGGCPLRIDGIPEIPEGHQLDIHLVNAGGEHHHENCGNRAVVMKGATWDPSVICAVKLPRSSEVIPGRRTTVHRLREEPRPDYENAKR